MDQLLQQLGVADLPTPVLAHCVQTPHLRQVLSSKLDLCPRSIRFQIDLLDRRVLRVPQMPYVRPADLHLGRERSMMEVTKRTKDAWILQSDRVRC